MDKMQKKLIADRWDEAHEKQLETLLQENEGMRKLFEEHPEKRELYKFKILDSEGEVFVGAPINPAYCKTCIFSHGKPPFEDLPEKSYCRIYTRANGTQKPPDVYYGGAECEYYEREKRKTKQ